MRQQKTGLGPPRQLGKLQGQPSSGGTSCPLQACWFSTGVGLEVGVVPKPPAGICPPAGRGEGLAGPLDSLTSMVVPRRLLDGFAESERVIQRQESRPLGNPPKSPSPFSWRLSAPFLADL